MKKFILSIFAIYAVAFTSCTKEDFTNIKSLEGTTWYDLSSDVSKRYIFYKNGTCEVKSDGIAPFVKGEQVIKYDYTYNEPEVKFTFVSSNAVMFGEMVRFSNLKGVVNGNEMTITNTESNKISGVITKL